VVAERQESQVEPPRMYQVVMRNDDFTPMEFVVMVLQEYFRRDLEAATQIMLKIHLDGKGVCGVYSRDVAATKVEQVLDAALKAGVIPQFDRNSGVAQVGAFGLAEMVDLAERLRQMGGRVQLTAISERDQTSVDPLRIRFRLTRAKNKA